MNGVISKDDLRLIELAAGAIGYHYRSRFVRELESPQVDKGSGYVHWNPFIHWDDCFDIIAGLNFDILTHATDNLVVRARTPAREKVSQATLMRQKLTPEMFRRTVVIAAADYWHKIHEVE